MSRIRRDRSRLEQSTRRSATLLVVILIVITVAACGDYPTSLTWHGQDYLGTGDPESYAIDQTVLRDVGRVDKTNDEASDGIAYRLPGVDSSIVVVLTHRDGTIGVFVSKTIFAALPTNVTSGPDPLYQALPELCPYFRTLPWGCGGPSPSPPPTIEPGGVRRSASA